MRLLRNTPAWLCLLALGGAVAVTYSNHFHNGFHFDDFHAVTGNVFIRDLRNIPRFFTDAMTSSSLPANRAWRPLVTVSLAMDYRLGHSYTPLYFHLSTFLWFLAQLTLMYVLFTAILRRCWPEDQWFWPAWFAVACYGLHPAVAETINYVIQRAEVMSTCCVVAGLAAYARLPGLRRYGIYLVPAAIGVLAKPPALIFPFLLFVYVFLVEEQPGWGSLAGAARKSAPALVVAVALAALQAAMTPKTFSAGFHSAYSYLITQPYVGFRYFTAFLLPLQLSADTDLEPLSTLWNLEALGGLLFLAVLLCSIIAAARQQRTRPVAFGLSWFLLAMIPTSVFPLAEVENSHRMFFPFVGLTLAAACAGSLLLRGVSERSARAVIAAALACLLLLLALGTRRRNEVWRTEETLWQDVTVKSPRNGRGLMNYGLTQMSKGDFQGALRWFEQAAVYAPNYPLLEINLGIANAALQRDAEAASHFHRAIQLNPQLADCYYYYGRWLKEKGRVEEAVSNLKVAVTLNPVFLDARYLLLAVYAERQRWNDLRALADDTLKLSPNDETVRKYANDRALGEYATDTTPSAAPKTPEAFLELSLRKYQAHDYANSIAAARQALGLNPGYAEAYNNIAAAHAALAEWDEAIAAAEQALRLKPDFPLARNNLAWALHKSVAAIVR